jgi:hypothetical protein
MNSYQSDVSQAYHGSVATRTRRLLKALERSGQLGKLAASLFRAHKASSRAKDYRGNYKEYAYTRKGECLAVVCAQLSESQLRWGWGKDTDGYLPEVLYVDLPQGQVSFHSVDRLNGPDYSGKWDGNYASEDRVLAFCSEMLEGKCLQDMRTAARERRRLALRRQMEPAGVPHHDTHYNWWLHYHKVAPAVHLHNLPAAAPLIALKSKPDHGSLLSLAAQYRQQEAEALASAGLSPMSDKKGRLRWRCRDGNELWCSNSGLWRFSRSGRKDLLARTYKSMDRALVGLTPDQVKK